MFLLDLTTTPEKLKRWASPQCGWFYGPLFFCCAHIHSLSLFRQEASVLELKLLPPTVQFGFFFFYSAAVYDKHRIQPSSFSFY